MYFKHLQGWQLCHFPEQPTPVFDNAFGEEILPNIPVSSTATGCDESMTIFLVGYKFKVNYKFKGLNVYCGCSQPVEMNREF